MVTAASLFKGALTRAGVWGFVPQRLTSGYANLAASPYTDATAAGPGKKGAHLRVTQALADDRRMDSNGIGQTGYETSSLRRMPSFLMRLRSVLGLTPRTRAAPSAPSMRQPVSLRTLTMW